MLVETVGNVRRIAAADEAALAEGVRPGQTLADALAMTPRLATADADPGADAQALLMLCDWCVRFSPAVAPHPPDGLIMEVDGSVGLWASEQAMLDEVVERFGRADIPACAAIADTIGAAWALARFGDGRTVIAGEATKAALGRLPVDALRLPDSAAKALVRLGVETVGQLQALPRASLARRFGPGVRQRLDQALGEAEEALAWRRPPAPFSARLAFLEPISAPEDLERVCRDILQVIGVKLAEAGRGGRQFLMAFHGVDGRARILEIGTSLPGRDPIRLHRLFATRLDTIDPGFGIEAVTLLAEAVEPLGARQGALESRRDPDFAGAGPEALVDRLVNRLGADRVWRPVPVESWAPERAVKPGPPLAPLPAADWPDGAWPDDRPRPIRLFARPEPIEATAPAPDDPPILFRWRGRAHRVRAAEGPERLAREWWRAPDDPGREDPARIRDYYRVEDVEGRRFWIFRSGLYAAGETPRWFVHGLFA